MQPYIIDSLVIAIIAEAIVPTNAKNANSW
jgi:hypothetical protein